MSTPLSATTMAHISRPEDEIETSSISDYDSEWTHVTQSEDENESRYPASRTDDSASHVETDVDSVGDRWEGLASQSFVESLTDSPEDSEPLLSSSEIQENSSYEEDNQMVNAGLECSVTSTLEAQRSRSAQSSLPSSMMSSKLKLSFPDPLLRSAEAIRSPPKVDNQLLEASKNAFSWTNADLGSSSTPEVSVVLEDVKKESQISHISYNLSLVLYGSSTASKWSIAEKVLSILLPRGDCTLEEDAGIARTYRCSYFCPPAKNSEADTFFQVVDRTLGADKDIEVNPEHSLAIVILPSAAAFLPMNHTFYLPIISFPTLDIPSSSSGFSTLSDAVIIDSARYCWEQLSIPDDKVLHLCRDEEIPKETTLQHTIADVFWDPRTQAFVFQGELSEAAMVKAPQRRAKTRYLRYLVLCATLTAGAVGTMWTTGSKFSPAPSLNYSHPLSAVPHNSISNSSVIPASLPTLCSSLVVSSLKDFALSVFNPTTVPSTHKAGKMSSLSQMTPPPASTSDAALPAYGCECDCAPDPILNNDAVLSKDVVLRPISALLTKSSSTGLQVTSPITKAPAGSCAWSVKSDCTHTKASKPTIPPTAVMEAINKDMTAIFEAIDELLGVLQRQVELIRSDWPSTQRYISFLSGGLQFRNERARINARKLKDIGTRFLDKTGNAVKQTALGTASEASVMMEHARTNAKRIKEVRARVRAARRQRRQERWQEREATLLKKQQPAPPDSDAAGSLRTEKQDIHRRRETLFEKARRRIAA